MGGSTGRHEESRVDGGFAVAGLGGGGGVGHRGMQRNGVTSEIQIQSEQQMASGPEKKKRQMMMPGLDGRNKNRHGDPTVTNSSDEEPQITHVTDSFS